MTAVDIFFEAERSQNWEQGLCCAARYGHIAIVNSMIGKGAANWNLAMSNAAYGGHMAIVELMINKGAIDWDWAMDRAAEGGHMAIVELMINKGATDWNEAMCCAAYGGHLAVVELLITKGAAKWRTEVVSFLKRDPNRVIEMYQRKSVSRELFVKHDKVFGEWIDAFLVYQREAAQHLYNTCLLPHVLSNIIVAF